MGRRAAISIALLCAVLVAPGCGSSGDTSTSSLTKAQLIQQGDAICEKNEAKYLAQVKALTQLTATHHLTKPQEGQAVSDYLVPSFRSQLHGLEKLGAPAGEDDQVGAILGEWRKALAEGEEDPANIVGSSSEPLAAAAALAQKYGFEVCLSGY